MKITGIRQAGIKTLLLRGRYFLQRIIQVEERPPLLTSIPLSLQHLFAMFGSTVLVPALFHVDASTILLMNGIGTLLYLLICKGKIPAYLGSSFAFISPVMVVLNNDTAANYPKALGAFIVVGLIFHLVRITAPVDRNPLAGRRIPASSNGSDRLHHWSGAHSGSSADGRLDRAGQHT
jgi:xanthine/uracil permease